MLMIDLDLRGLDSQHLMRNLPQEVKAVYKCEYSQYL